MFANQSVGLELVRGANLSRQSAYLRRWRSLASSRPPEKLSEPLSRDSFRAELKCRKRRLTQAVTKAK